MSDSNNAESQPTDLDERAAQIDARSEDAAEQVEELIDDAQNDVDDPPA